MVDCGQNYSSTILDQPELIHLTNLLKHVTSVNQLLIGDYHSDPSNIHDQCILVGTNVPINPEWHILVWI